MRKAKAKHDAIVFYPDKIRKGFAIGVPIGFSIAFVIYMQYMFAGSGISYMLIPIIISLGIGMWRQIILCMQSYIEFRDKEMLLVRGGSTLAVPYNAMKKLQPYPRPYSRTYGIRLSHPIQPVTKGIADRLFFGWKTDFIDMRPYSSVSASNYLDQRLGSVSLKYQTIGEVFRVHAPHLIAD